MLQKSVKNEYKGGIRESINKRLKKIFLSFLGCIVFLAGSAAFINYYSLPEILVPILVLPCGFSFVYQVFSLKNIKCPYCKNSLYTSLYYGDLPIGIKTITIRKCNNCGAEIL